MKASVSVALVFAGVCLAGRAGAQTVVVGPQAGSMALLPGTQVTVPIVADLTGSGGASLGSVTARLLWQPGVLAFRGVSGGVLGQPVVNADSAGGSLRFALANPAGATGQPVLVNALFAVIGAPGASDTLRVQLDELTQTGTFADLLGIGATTSSRLCVSTGLFGDLNSDALVNSFDALVIVTSAVGLPITPYTTVNGDVDADGQVTTRDALIVLSYAIALPVNGFHVGGMNPGACALQAPASVHIEPTNASVAVGDVFPLTATVRDSGGAAVHGVDLVWTSGDTAVVKADATGHLVGVAAGSGWVYAYAAPGLKDSAAVIVDAVRHVWWVNPGGAALNGGVELGSSTRPFSSIGQAVARAAAGDTIHIAAATYGDTLRLTKGLTLLGDSTLAGALPVIRNPAGPGVAVGPLGEGFVRLSRLRIEDSQGGLVVNGADSVLVDWVAVARSHAAGFSFTNVGRVQLDHAEVSGAIGQGISATGVPSVHLHAVLVDAVATSGLGGGTAPYGLHIVGSADSVVADSLFLLTAGAWVDSARVVLIDGLLTAGTDGPAFAALIGERFSLDHADVADVRYAENAGVDSVPAVVALLRGASATARVANTIIRNSGRTGLALIGGDSVLVTGVSIQNTQSFVDGDAAFFQSTRRVVVHGSSFLDNNNARVAFGDTAHVMQVSLDSVGFRNTRLDVSGAGALAVRWASFQGGNQTPLVTYDVPIVSLVLVEQSGLGQPPSSYDQYGGPFAIDVNGADSLYLGGLYVHDNPLGGLICRSCRAVQADSSTFLRNGFVNPYYGQAGTLVLEHPALARLSGLTIDGGGAVGLWLRGGHSGGSRFVVDTTIFRGQTWQLLVDQTELADTLVVNGSIFHGRNVPSGYGVQAENLGSMTVFGSAFDSTSNGIGASYTRTVTIRGNTFIGMGQEAVQAAFDSLLVVDSNTVAGCANSPSDAFHYYAVNAWTTRNTVSGCMRGVNASNGGDVGLSLVIRGNDVRRDSLQWGESVHVDGQYDSLVVAGNTIQGGLGTGMMLYGGGSSGWSIASARVDSNTVQGMLGDGIRLYGLYLAPVELTYNTLADNDTNGLLASVTVAGTYNTVVRNKLNGVSLLVSPSAFRFSNYTGNVQYAIVSYGGPPPAIADSSYWGDPLGPSCPNPALCAPASVGDSAGVGLDPTQFPLFSSTWVVAAPPLPGPPAAPAFRVARPGAALPARAGARPVRGPVVRPRPTASVQPRRVQP